MARYQVTERQVLVYTWEVNSEDYETEEALEDALGAIDGVPDAADCHIIESSTRSMLIEA